MIRNTIVLLAVVSLCVPAASVAFDCNDVIEPVSKFPYHKETRIYL